eukprot:180322-Amphidinium_carterae.1
MDGGACVLNAGDRPVGVGGHCRSAFCTNARLCSGAVLSIAGDQLAGCVVDSERLDVRAAVDRY